MFTVGDHVPKYTIQTHMFLEIAAIDVLRCSRWSRCSLFAGTYRVWYEDSEDDSPRVLPALRKLSKTDSSTIESTAPNINPRPRVEGCGSPVSAPGAPPSKSSRSIADCDCDCDCATACLHSRRIRMHLAVSSSEIAVPKRGAGRSERRLTALCSFVSRSRVSVTTNSSSTSSKR